MHGEPLVLAVDQGTGSTKTLLVDPRGAVLRTTAVPVALSAPAAGHVEQSPDELWASCEEAVRLCITGINPGRIAGLAVSNQRESVLLWERSSGRPVGPMLSWQDQRTAPDQDRMTRAGFAEEIRSRSGLPLDPMFSALKAKWLLDTHDPGRRRSRTGELCLGTVDSWLLFRISGGLHLTEVGNASRTQLLNLRARTWDVDLLDLFGVPRQTLPDVVPSSGVVCRTSGMSSLPDGIPVVAVMGDSHAALFAQMGWRPGRVKATYGSGSSVMALLDGEREVPTSLCTTLAWEVDEPAWAIEGTNRSAGSTLVWLAQLFESTPESLVADLAEVESSGVSVVPAFNGLAAPWWDDSAAAVISGLRYSSGRRQIARAGLESISHQVEDVVGAFEDAGVAARTLLVDGGPASNPVLTQFQADVSGRRIERAAEPNLSALGVAHLAGISIGLWSRSDLDCLDRAVEVFEPRMDEARRSRLRREWLTAVSRARLAEPS